MSKTAFLIIILTLSLMYNQTSSQTSFSKTNKTTSCQTTHTKSTGKHADDDLKLLYEKSIETEDGKTLTASSVAGNIEISVSDKTEVNVKIFGNDEAEKKLIFDSYKTDEGVKVDCGQKKDGNLHNLNLKMVITVPVNYNVDLFTGGGSITVEDLKGAIKMNTSGGNIEINRTKGNITAFTSGGNIATDSTSGNIELSTSGGTIKAVNYVGDISASTLGGHITLKGSNGFIKTSTSGGNIRIDYTGPNNGIDASTLGGNIIAFLPSDFDADADIGTLAGRVECDFAKVDNDKITSFLKTKFNNGGKTLKCITTGGNIVIAKK
jgi:hypothetical protein